MIVNGIPPTGRFSAGLLATGTFWKAILEDGLGGIRDLG